MKMKLSAETRVRSTTRARARAATSDAAPHDAAPRDATVDYFLGSGPHTATRVEHASGGFEIRMFDGKIVGHGNTPKEAAVHLAKQLREIARLVEAREGQKG
jgi:hypothetical protein